VIESAIEARADLIVVGTHPAAQMPMLMLHTLSGCLLRRSILNVLCVPNEGASLEAERASLTWSTNAMRAPNAITT